jgi:phospholipid N-methyltransferase
LFKSDALQLKDILKQNGIDKVDCIISGLPLGHFSSGLKRNILEKIKNSLSDHGIYVQFEYFLAGIKSIKRFFPNVTFSFELLNIPPAFVIRCKK